MRVHLLGVALLAATVAALLAAPAFARPTLSFPVNVTMTNSTCVLNYKSVSKQNTRIVFHIINNSSVSHGFDITAKFHSPLIKPHQEGTLVANLGRPGAYRYACVAAHSTLKKGIFTIRTS